MENPENIISKSGFLRGKINSNYPLPKRTEKVLDEKMKGRDSSPSVRDNTQNVMHSEAKHLSKKTAPEPETKVKANKTNLGFVYDGDIKKAILRIIDEETKKVVFQIPPEDVIARMKKDLIKTDPRPSVLGAHEMSAGIIVDEKV